MPLIPTAPKTPGDVDVEVGHRIKTLRSQCGMTQQKLAELTGVTFQQVQKYENGKNRISAGRLKRISEILGVDIGYLYGSEAQTSGDAPDAGAIEAFVEDQAAWPLIKAWPSLPVAVRARLGQLVFTMTTLPEQPVIPEPAARAETASRARRLERI